MRETVIIRSSYSYFASKGRRCETSTLDLISAFALCTLISRSVGSCVVCAAPRLTPLKTNDPRPASAFADPPELK
eukprot:12929231-Prorocentrum_lima.AAC.1